MKIIKNSIFNSGLLLLIYFFVTLIFSSILFVFDMSISTVSAIISIFLSVLMYSVVNLKKQKTESFIGGILAIAIFVLAIFASQLVYDFAHDSNWYHKAAIGSLANGWNPVYEKFGEFSKNSQLNITDMEYAEVFTQHYAKGAWIVGANIYSITNDIESAKAINLIMAYILFCLTVHFLSSTYLKWWQAIIVGVLFVYNPLTVSQIFTLYVDNLLYTTLMAIIVALIGISDKKYVLDEGIKYLVLSILVVFCINIKFTGLAYAGVFCLLFYIIWIIHSIINKDFKKTFIKNTVFYIITCSIAIFLVGFSTYVTNYIEDGHPFYPLAGENKRDIMTGNQPTAFNKINGVQRLLISTFAETSNDFSTKLPKLKFPFQVKEKEAEIAAMGVDTRLSGFGPLFGGMLCFSATILTFGMYCLLKFNKYWFYILTSVIVVILTLLLCIEESWWARYSPYFYLIPMIAVVLFFIAFNNEVKLFKFLIGVITALFIFCCVKNTNYFVKYIETCRIETIQTKENLEYAKDLSKESQIKIAINSSSHYGIEYNLKDKGIEYIKEAPNWTISKPLYGRLMYME